MRERLRSARRVVVKVGTSTITDVSGRVNRRRIAEIAAELSDIKKEGREVILVTSGAIAVGVNEMGLAERPSGIAERQAMAAVGQGALMHTYEMFFDVCGERAGQVLLTRENYMRHSQYTNSRRALLTMLSMGIVPIVNENDAVSLDELKIGDNDTLSATVASLVDADALVILSDVEGLFTGNPQSDPAARIISEVREITPEIEALAGGAGSALATGGMATKIEAAKIATSAGVTLVITLGSERGAICAVLAGEERGTVFPAKESHLRARKAWLAFGRNIEGDLHVDEGAVRAVLTGGSSLLAAGLVSVEGEFDARSTVRVLAPNGREIARGIVNFDTKNLESIVGKKTEEIRLLLPQTSHEEVIHRDDMVIMA